MQLAGASAGAVHEDERSTPSLSCVRYVSCLVELVLFRDCSTEDEIPAIDLRCTSTCACTCTYMYMCIYVHVLYVYMCMHVHVPKCTCTLVHMNFMSCHWNPYRIRTDPIQSGFTDPLINNAYSISTRNSHRAISFHYSYM